MNEAKSQPITSQPQIFEYLDYRKFLIDWVEWAKASEAKFSLRKLSLKSGLSSGFLPQVLSGHKSLSDKSVSKLAKGLELSSKEAKFLSLIVTLAEASQQDVRVKALQNIQKFEGFKSKNPNELEAYKYLSQWYYVAIKEMAEAPGFVADPKWIQQRLIFHVSAENIKRALQYLQDNGFLTINKDLSADTAQKKVACKDGVFQLLLGHHHKSMIDLSAQALEKVPKDKRKVVGYTYAIDEESFAEVKNILNEALQKVANLEKKQKSDTKKNVYHVELTAFPLTGDHDEDE